MFRRPVRRRRSIRVLLSLHGRTELIQLDDKLATYQVAAGWRSTPANQLGRLGLDNEIQSSLPVYRDKPSRCIRSPRQTTSGRERLLEAAKLSETEAFLPALVRARTTATETSDQERSPIRQLGTRGLAHVEH